MKLKCMQLQKNKPAATPEIATTQVSIITFNAAVSAEAKCRFCLCLAMPYYGTEIKNSCFLSKHWVHLGLHMNPYMFKGSGRWGYLYFSTLGVHGCSYVNKSWKCGSIGPNEISRPGLPRCLWQRAAVAIVPRIVTASSRASFFCLWGGQHTRAWLRCKMV